MDDTATATATTATAAAATAATATAPGSSGEALRAELAEAREKAAEERRRAVEDRQRLEEEINERFRTADQRVRDVERRLLQHHRQQGHVGLTGITGVHGAFHFLPNPADVLRAATACRRWRELACTDSVWRARFVREGLLEKARAFEVALPAMPAVAASALRNATSWPAWV